MATINATLDSFVTPGFANYEPKFGRIKPRDQPVSSREAASNIAMPFQRERPFLIIEDSNTTVIEANSLFEIKESDVTLSLGNASFEGCVVRVINTSDGEAVIEYAGEEKDIQTAESLSFEFIDGKWRLQSLIVTEDPGDGSADGMITKQSTTGKLKLIGFEKLQQRIVGEVRTLAFALPQEEMEWLLAKHRLMPLNYQVIEIALYPELCERMYCGDTNNATALFWYKCRNDANKTPDINGTHMRVADWRGLFLRNAGQNAVLRTDMANPSSPPYDGKDIGSVGLDAMPDHGHRFRDTLLARNIAEIHTRGNAGTATTISTVHTVNGNPDAAVYSALRVDTVQAIVGGVMPRLSYEVTPAWLAILYYIIY